MHAKKSAQVEEEEEVECRSKFVCIAIISEGEREGVSGVGCGKG